MATVASPEFIRGVVLYLDQTLDVQLVNTNITGKQQYFTQISNISTRVYQNDI